MCPVPRGQVEGVPGWTRSHYVSQSAESVHPASNHCCKLLNYASHYLMADENGVVGADSLPETFPENEPSPKHPIYECSLSPGLIAKAREELQEKPEWRLRDAQALRDMIRKDYPNLPTRVDDAFLLRFLRARKFDYDKALQLLVNYHGCRRSWPEVFNNLKPSAIKTVLDSGFVTVLPHPDMKGQQIVCIRPGNWVPSSYPITENIRAIYLTLEKLIQTEATQVNGIVILADYSGVGFSHASHFGPFLAKKTIGILQDGFPIRIKAVNIINEPRIFKGIFAILKPFLKEKIANRFFLHGSNLNSLHGTIPRSILPEQYGGTAGRLDTSVWNETLMSSEHEFVEQFCQPSPLDDGSLYGLLGESEASEVQCEDSFRGVKSQLYYCY